MEFEPRSGPHTPNGTKGNPSVTLRTEKQVAPTPDQSSEHQTPRVKRAAARTALLTGAAALTLTMVACQQDGQGIADPRTPIEPGSRGALLYEANCAACHGPGGQGDGIAAIALKVKPRDFYNEPFRYVSSTDGVATDEDLAQTIRLGRPDGEMPAAPWLMDDEVAVLAEYVREINRLGWVERLENEFQGDEALEQDEIEDISWDRVTAMEHFDVPSPSASFTPDSSIGLDLYMQTCASCHGPRGTGEGLDTPLDELGKPIVVRNLTSDPIRGGASPEELFKRIRSGIPGTPMPAQLGYSDDDVWQLVYYTRVLMGRPLH